MTSIPNFGWTIGQQFQLNINKDWSFKFPPGKKQTALIGLAIDRRIRHELAQRTDLDIMAPLNQYAPYDLYVDGLHLDIKSFSKKTVSISEAEYRLVRRLWAKGTDLAYVLFEQIEGGREYEELFVYRGCVLASDLKDAGELRDSTIDTGAYFFVSNVQSLIKG